MVETLRDFLAPNQDGFELGTLQMMLRAFMVYIIALALVRLGSKRFMGRNTAFDLILGIILGSVVSRGITGQSPFWPTMAAGAVLLAMHWAMAILAFYWSRFGPWIKGRATLLIRDGEVLKDNMCQSRVGDHDLEEALRAAGLTSIKEVALAHLERNGNINVIPRKSKTRVLEVTVKDGVQTVRIELG